MGNLTALIFDVDGTLAETEYDHLAAFNAAFADAGLDWYWSVALYTHLLKVTGSRERMRHYIEHYQPHFKRHNNLEGLLAQLQEQKNHYYAERVRQGVIRLRPGVARLLREARAAGLQLAIASTASRENIQVLLDSTLERGASDWFALIAAGEVVTHKKPSPEIYHWLLNQLALEANECVAFEDSGNGVRAAVAAGVRTVVTVSELTKHDDFTGAAVVLDSFGEPDRPFRVIRGEVGKTSLVDVAFLRRLRRGD